MPLLYPYRLFISHVWWYNEEYYRLIKYLNAAPNFKYINYSVPEHDAFARCTRAQLQESLRKQMGPAQVVLILAGMYANHSDWMDFEISYARVCRKPIIGIRPWGAERVPASIQLAAKEMVYWSTSSIVDAIRRAVA